MKGPVGSAQIRRPVDRSHARRPLRLEITRRVARDGAGHEKFFTQVRVGEAEAVVVPFDSGRRRRESQIHA